MATMQGLEMVLQLRLPGGDVEQVLVGAATDGIAVLMKMLPLKKKYRLPEDLQIFRPDGAALELDKPIAAQGLHEGAMLQVGDAAAPVVVEPAGAEAAPEASSGGFEAADASAQAALAWYGQCLSANGERGLFPKPLDESGEQGVRSLARDYVRAELKKDLDGQAGQLPAFDAAEDSDGEEVTLCHHCRLPLGSVYCGGDAGEGPCMHAECKAQLLMQDLRKEEEGRLQKDSEKKLAKRVEFDIGWKVERVPRNLGALGKLEGAPATKGMVCVQYNEGSHSVGLAPTVESSAAVNLEYLSLALQVRLLEGCEPFFSLDPVDPTQPFSMQFKRFEPSWLAGTSAGEVLFQADYHLKELSMGEYVQPVVGMKSCFDFSEEEGHEKAWNAREWFVVRNAEVFVTEDDVLIPYVNMGVEARETIMGKDGRMEDVKVTRGDHPLVKYADAFTHNFDLIAERKSVIYQLREMAKASILAKFLLESGVELESSWLNLANEEGLPCCMEIPQLWNERCYSKIQVQDGQIVSRQDRPVPKLHGVYGGADLGLERFRLQVPRRAVVSRPGMRAPVAAGIATRPGVRPSAVVPPAAAVAHAPTRVGVASRPGLRPSRASAPAVAFEAWGPAPRASAISAVSAPRGVDLNLGEFDLTEAARVTSQALATPEQADAFAAIGGAFWAGLKDSAAAGFSEEDRRFLKSVFHPELSDRSKDGDRFVPPDASSTYMQNLRALVQEEKALQQRRKDHFLSADFSADAAGPLFPSSWSVNFEIARGQKQAARSLLARPEYRVEAQVLDNVLKSSTPAFDKKTEDGTRFRVYKLGSLEVRTTQEIDGKEIVGVVYSVQPGERKDVRTTDSAKVVKVTEYVEQACHRQAVYRRYYVVLETEQGTIIVTEKLADGAVAWNENPVELEDRNSLAKVIRTADYRCASINIRAMKRYKDECSSIAGASSSQGKHYAHGVYSRCLQLSVDAADDDCQAEVDDAEQESTTDSSEKEPEAELDYSDKKEWMFRKALQFNSRQREL